MVKRYLLTNMVKLKCCHRWRPGATGPPPPVPDFDDLNLKACTRYATNSMSKKNYFNKIFNVHAHVLIFWFRHVLTDYDWSRQQKLNEPEILQGPFWLWTWKKKKNSWKSDQIRPLRTNIIQRNLRSSLIDNRYSNNAKHIASRRNRARSNIYSKRQMSASARLRFRSVRCGKAVPGRTTDLKAFSRLLPPIEYIYQDQWNYH